MRAVSAVERTGLVNAGQRSGLGPVNRSRIGTPVIISAGAASGRLSALTER
jgi:hypothetical protein